MSEHYAIPKEPGRFGALLLAVVVHLALVAFLWIGVSWQSSEHGGVEAEIWDTKYREAAPTGGEVMQEQPPQKPEPKPVPQAATKPEPKPAKQELNEVKAKADIALAQEKKRQKQEDDKRKKDEANKKKKEAEDKRKQELADQKAREKMRQEEMRRLAGKAGAGPGGGTGGSGTALRSTGNNRLDPGYANKIGAKIRSNTSFVVPNNLDGNPAVEYAIELLPDGSLRTRPRKLKSSGVPGFDDAVLRAIEKSEPFPPDRSGKVPSSFTLIHKPKG